MKPKPEHLRFFASSAINVVSQGSSALVARILYTTNVAVQRGEKERRVENGAWGQVPDVVRV